VNIGIITVAFNEPDLIGPCIKQFDGFNFPHLVLVSKKPWRGDYVMDETWAKAKMYLRNGQVIVDEWPNQAAQFNFGLHLLHEEGVDWALIVDADEFYTPEDIGRLVGQIRTTQYDAILATNMDVYWKSPEYKIIPDQYDYPVIAIKTNKRFKDKRHVESDVTTTNTHGDITLHHMSYVRTNEQMKKKIKTFEHSHEFNTDQWYEDIWLWWEPDHIALHPVVPPLFKQATYNPAPKVISELINWSS
jgi:glycosyltransferase involved in cell wall biosynthesis